MMIFKSVSTTNKTLIMKTKLIILNITLLLVFYINTQAKGEIEDKVEKIGKN
jgi:hypothetical protein